MEEGARVSKRTCRTVLHSEGVYRVAIINQQHQVVGTNVNSYLASKRRPLMLFEHSLGGTSIVSCTSVERDWSAANPFHSCAKTALQDPTGPSSEARQANTYCGTVR